MLKVRIQLEMRTRKHPAVQTRGHLYPDPTMTSSIFNPPPKPQPQMSNCPPPLYSSPSPKTTRQLGSLTWKRKLLQEVSILSGGLDPNRAGSTEQGREEGSGAGDGALPPPLRKHNLRPVTQLVPGAQSTEILPVTVEISYELL